MSNDIPQINQAIQKLVNSMNAQDGNDKDNKIEASVWNKFIESVQSQQGCQNIGKKINNYITLDNAVKAIQRYAEAAAKTISGNVESIASRWIEMLGGNKNIPAARITPAEVEIPEKPENGEKLSGDYLKYHTANTEIEEEGGKIMVYDYRGLTSEVKEKYTTQDAEGNPVEAYRTVRTVSYGTNTLNSYTDIEYNAEGKKSKEITYRPDGKLLSMIVYNADGSVTEVKYLLSGGIDEMHRREFDDNGNVIRDYVKYDDDELEDYIMEYEYDNYGNVTRETRYGTDGKIQFYEDREGTSLNAKVTLRSPNGLKVDERTEFSLPTAVTPPEVELPGPAESIPEAKELTGLGYTEPDEDNKGKTVKNGDGTKKRYNEDGFIFDEYDANLKKTREISRNADGSVRFIDDYEYDVSSYANVKKTRLIRRNADGSVEFFTDYEYDANVNKTRWIRRNADGSVESIIDYEYDANVNETRWIHRYVDGFVGYWRDLEYNASGNNIRRVYRNSDGSVEHFEDYINGEWNKFKPDGTELPEE